MPSVTNNKSKAFILYLFGFFLFSASPVFADEYQDGLQACKQLQWDGAKGSKNIKKNCFRDLAIARNNAGIEETAQLERQADTINQQTLFIISNHDYVGQLRNAIRHVGDTTRELVEVTRQMCDGRDTDNCDEVRHLERRVQDAGRDLVPGDPQSCIGGTGYRSKNPDCSCDIATWTKTTFSPDALDCDFRYLGIP